MKLLLDTHVWLWWNTEPERLATAARRQIGDARNEVFLSAASVWEMAIKRRLGKLPLPEPVASYVARRLAADSVAALPVSLAHAAAVETLEPQHRDPNQEVSPFLFRFSSNSPMCSQVNESTDGQRGGGI